MYDDLVVKDFGEVKIKFKDGIISKILGLAETIIENVLGISLNLNMVLNFTFYIKRELISEFPH